jgi:hypothetical protein
MTTIRGLPLGHYVMAWLDHTTAAAVPYDDPLAPLARRRPPLWDAVWHDHHGEGKATCLTKPAVSARTGTAGS